MNAVFLVWCGIAVTSLSLGEAPAKDQVTWLPAKVYSIEVGASQIKDLTRSLGKPKHKEPS